MASEMRSEDDDVISFLDILNVIAKRKILILSLSLAAALLAIAYSLLSIVLPPSASPLPNVYTAKALIMLKSPSSSSSSNALGELSGLASLIGVSTGSSSSSPTELVLALMKQETFLDQLTEDLSLIEHYGLAESKAPRTEARSRINRSLKATVDDQSGIITISYKDINPDFSAEAAKRSVEILKTRYSEVTLKLAQDRLSAIEDSIVSSRVQLEEAQKRFTAFQTKYGFYDLQAGTSASLEMISKASQELLELQNRLSTLQAYRSADDPALAALKQQIEIAKKRLQELRRGSPELEGIAIPPDKLLEVASEYALLKGDLTIQQGIYASLKQQLESTKIEEISGSRIFTVIQDASVPEVKSGPSRGLISAIVTMAAFFLSILLAFVLEYGERVSRDPTESAKLMELKSHLRLSRGKK